MTAKTLAGLEEILKDELDKIGASKTEILKRAVGFEGDDELMYRVNYSCRSALRVLKPIVSFEIPEQNALYDNIKAISWEDWLEPTSTFAVDSVIAGSVFTNSQFVSLKTKDAIVDRLREKWGSRPSIDLNNPSLRINIHLFKTNCTVSIDTSGRSLHKRGYRLRAGVAPLNEVLAAGLIRLSGWDMKSPLLDPMCGSGTILIEAAMLVKNIPAAYFNPEFGFMKWKDFDAECWHKIKAQEDEKIIPSDLQLFGADLLSKAVEMATANIRHVGLQEMIKVKNTPFDKFHPPDTKGFLITNPPYDERLQVDDIIDFYKGIGDILKKRYTGWEAWVISSDQNALKFIGLHPSRKISVFNGPLECRFVRFQMY